jgi:ubiquinone/menaquinone biosynthesis C-methylase UbiE
MPNMQEEILKRYSDFSSSYDRFRPSPPEELIVSLKKLCKNSMPELVVDLGSGTGLSTRVWAKHAESVIGVEPSMDMLRVAEENTGDENIKYVSGYGHQTKLKSNTADIVTASSSIHWMDPEPSAKEITRILKDGGVFCNYGYRYPLFPEEWKIHQLYKDFRIKLDTLEKKYKDEGSPVKYNYNTIKDTLKNTDGIVFLDEFFFHKKLIWSYSDFINWVFTLGGILFLKKHNLSEENIGLTELQKNSKTLFNGKELEVLFSYKTFICIKE